MAKWLDDGCTASALEHRFRPIKAAAKHATAEKYGDGTTGKAISTRFERMRKEPSWDLSIAPAATNNSLGATPRKQRIPRTPKKSPTKKPKKATARDNEMSDDDSDLGMETPSKRESPIKKEALNKVKGGRVEKKLSLPSRAAKSGKSYIESDDEDEDGESIVIKDEDVGAMDFGRAADGDEDLLGGGGFGNGNDHTNGESLSDDEDQFYDDES